MTRWFCPQCGQENNGNFCTACGTTVPQPLRQAAESEQAVSSPQPSPFVVTFETGRHYKVHKSYVWLGPVVAVLAVAVIALANSMPGIMQGISALRDSDVHIPVFAAVVGVVVGLVALYGIVLAVYALAYKNMSYVFDEREFSFYSGIITKRRTHIPYARVQSVNHRATIVQRLAGVCSVSIDSAGGASNRRCAFRS